LNYLNCCAGVYPQLLSDGGGLVGVCCAYADTVYLVILITIEKKIIEKIILKYIVL
jgi:hypothetical protein